MVGAGVGGGVGVGPGAGAGAGMGAVTGCGGWPIQPPRELCSLFLSRITSFLTDRMIEFCCPDVGWVTPFAASLALRRSATVWLPADDIEGIGIPLTHGFPLNHGMGISSCFCRIVRYSTSPIPAFSAAPSFNSCSIFFALSGGTVGCMPADPPFHQGVIAPMSTAVRPSGPVMIGICGPIGPAPVVVPPAGIATTGPPVPQPVSGPKRFPAGKFGFGLGLEPG